MVFKADIALSISCVFLLLLPGAPGPQRPVEALPHLTPHTPRLQMPREAHSVNESERVDA